MRWFVATLAALFVAGATACQAAYWYRDLDQAKAHAKRDNKVLLVDFYADWCAPCRVMDEQVWGDPAIVRLTSKLVLVRVDADKSESLKRWYDVEALPTMLFLDGHDNKALHVTGFRPVSIMQEILAPFPESIADVNEMYEKAEADQDNGHLQLELAERYRAYGMYALSNRFYERAVKTDLVRNDKERLEQVRFAIALNSVHLNDPHKSIDLLEECLERYEDTEHRARCYLALVRAGAMARDKGTVKRYYERLQEEFPNSEEARSASEFVGAMQ